MSTREWASLVAFIVFIGGSPFWITWGAHLWSGRFW